MSSFPESSTSTTGAETTTTTTSSNPEPQPGTSQDPIINTDDPKPGPSTTAADFDLEVFDSGSSCSLEDCWNCPDIQTTPKQSIPPITIGGGGGGKSVKKTSKQLDLSVEDDDLDNSENEFDDLHVSTMSASPFNAEPMESACPSETEEAISDDEDEDEDKMDDDDGDQDHCQCPKSLIALPPLRLSEAVNSNNSSSTSSGSSSSTTSTSLLNKSSCWKCAGPSTSTASLTLCSLHATSSDQSTENIDEIVQDHDNFGTDENEDDSSLDSTSSCLGMSLLVKDTPAEELLAIPANKIGGFKRKSNEDQLVNPSGFIDHSITAKKKRETFISEEQEVCLTPIAIETETTEALIQDEDEVDQFPLVDPPKNLESWLEMFSSWTHTESLVAINQLIMTRCHPTQVRHMMSVIEPQFQRDFISLLPKELALYVLSFLHPRDLLRAAQTCRYWRILAEDNLLWREKCREAGLSDDINDMMNFRSKNRSRSATNFQYSPWKGGFMRQHNIEINWRVRGIRTPKVLKGHDDHVITCLQFNNSRIVSGSDDNTLKVWNATTGKCLRTLAGHTGGVWSSQMQGNIIVSGSTDRTLKVWNAENGQCMHTLHGHTSTVRCMHLHGKRVVSGSRDATLRMWDIDSGECLHVLMGHVAAVRCVQYDGRLVVSGAYDYMVKVWNPETEECIHTLSGHTNRVYSLQFDGIHVVSGSLDTSIRVWDVETGACKHALMGHQSLTSGMELRNNILVSGNADSTVKVWDITTGQCLQTLTGNNKHQSAVTCLQFNSKFVITSSDDGTVKLWDVKSGEFIRDLVALESGGSGGVVWRIRANSTKLVCAVGSRNGTEETKLLVLDFDVHDSK